MERLLNMLVVFINDSVRHCKVSLETEEKSKDIAFLQGRITGYRLLLSFLQDRFSLKPSFIEDTEDIPVPVKELSNEEIEKLFLVTEGLLLSDEWSGVVDDVLEKQESLKNFLLHEAENARDLYISQAQYAAVTCYEVVFNNIKKEKKRIDEELPFKSEEAQDA